MATSKITGTYYYGNGDYYTISGYIDAFHGGGPYIYGNDQWVYYNNGGNDSYNNQVTEENTAGYYIIHTSQLLDGSDWANIIKTEINIDKYYDHETDKLYTPYFRKAGKEGLGSEWGYLTSNESSFPLLFEIP